MDVTGEEVGRRGWRTGERESELDDFTRFVFQASYDSTWSFSRQFPIDRDIIQLEDFIPFLSDSTKPSPLKFSYDHELI